VTNEVLDRGAAREFAPDAPSKTVAGPAFRLNRRFGLALLGLLLVGGLAWYG
jgi:hypothetical protein